MNEIFARANEKFVKSVVIYGKASDNYAYADAEFKTKIDKDSLMNLCMKGFVVISYGAAFYNPVCFKANSAKGCTSITFWNTEVSTAAAVTLNSSEFTA